MLVVSCLLSGSGSSFLLIWVELDGSRGNFVWVILLVVALVVSCVLGVVVSCLCLDFHQPR